MWLFDCSENDEAEVTNVDKENHDVEELVLTNVQSTGNRLSKTNGDKTWSTRNTPNSQ